MSEANELGLEPVRDVAQRLIGRKPSATTVWRWMRVGSRGSKLPAVMVLGRWCCTESQFRDFISGTARSVEP